MVASCSCETTRECIWMETSALTWALELHQAKQRSAHGGSAALSIKKDSQITHAAIVGFDFFSINFRKRKYFWGKCCKLFVPLSFSTLSITALPLRVLTQKPKNGCFALHVPLYSFWRTFGQKIIKYIFLKLSIVSLHYGKGYLKGCQQSNKTLVGG